MKELSLIHIPAQDDQPAQIRVAFTLRPGTQALTQTVPFEFTFSKEERYLIQWYMDTIYAQDSEQGLLAFEKADGSSDLISGERLGKLFAGKSAPIVLLNPRQTGMTH